MTITNHWGKWLDSEKPIVGVYSNNDISQFIVDESYDCINLDWENAKEDWLSDNPKLDEDSDEFNEWAEYWESSGADTLLIGDWTKDEAGLYTPDETGEYAAIVNEITTQVVWSKTVKRIASLCSPCYPGQSDVNVENNKVLESDRGYLTYCLPDNAYYD